MELSKAIDLDLHGRGFDGIFGDGSELDTNKYALLQKKAMDDFNVHHKPGVYIDYDLYGRGDPRAFEAAGGGIVDQELALNIEGPRTRRFSLRAFLVPLKMLKKKLGAFVRKLSGNRTRNSVDPDSPRSVSGHTETQVTVFEDDRNNFDTAPSLEGESDIISMSPIRGVGQLLVAALPAEETPATTLQNDRNSVTVTESADEVTDSDTEELAHEDRIDNVPRRVRSKLPSEEEPPHVEPGMVSKAIEKLNSSSSFEFRQASSLVKKASLLPLPSSVACAATKISSSTDRILEPNSCKVASDGLSLTRPSAASEENKILRKSENSDAAPSGRVEFLRLSQTRNRPGLFRYGMESSYEPAQALRSLGANSSEGNSALEEPAISSPRDLFSVSVDLDQLISNEEEPGNTNSKLLAAGGGLRDVANDIMPSVGRPVPQGETTNFEESIKPFVPKSLSDDSQADLDGLGCS